jgi:GNAT superfamily N-acetyltransferase
VLDVELRDRGLAGFTFVEREIARPWVKDYDAERGNHPTDWPKRFDMRAWGLLSAWEGPARVGGALVAFDTAGVSLLGGRRDVALLWDIRVRPDHRQHGIGRMLFAAVEDWARRRGCVRLDIETQTNNVAACRFYAHMGCELRAIDRFAYPNLPDEVSVLWSKPL